MNAATSPYGYLTDIALASALSALPVVLLVRQASDGALRSPVTVALGLLALAPVAIALGLSATLRGAREQVVTWLASLPFAVDNVNALLVGLTDELEIAVDDAAPGYRDDGATADRRALQLDLDRISEDALVTRCEDGRICVKLGVVESKWLPLRTCHARWVRFQRVITEFVVPLSRRVKITGVRVC